MAPENQVAYMAYLKTEVASMRPGLDGPGKPRGRISLCNGSISFNEAGAGWPRKTTTTAIQAILAPLLQ